MSRLFVIAKGIFYVTGITLGAFVGAASQYLNSEGKISMLAWTITVAASLGTGCLAAAAYMNGDVERYQNRNGNAPPKP